MAFHWAHIKYKIQNKRELLLLIRIIGCLLCIFSLDSISAARGIFDNATTCVHLYRCHIFAVHKIGYT